MPTWTITNLASDMSSACTVSARTKDDAVMAFACEHGFDNLDQMGLSVADLAIELDDLW